jgi:hypothetical protein
MIELPREGTTSATVDTTPWLQARNRRAAQGNACWQWSVANAVIEFVAAALSGAPCMVEAAGNTAGLRTGCKKGDVAKL